MENNLPNVIIADDHDMFRDALKTMLEFDSIANVLGQVSNGMELLEMLNETQPDIVLMDIDMPTMNGIEASKKIQSEFPDIKVLTLSMFGDEKYYKEMIQAGAMGFVLKSSNKSELEEAIKSIYKGQSYFSNDLLLKIIHKIGVPANHDIAKQKLPDFTDRELDVLQLLCKGLSTNEIAEKLFLSAKTIENYRVKLLQKTSSKNSVGLVVYAIKNEIVEI